KLPEGEGTLRRVVATLAATRGSLPQPVATLAATWGSLPQPVATPGIGSGSLPHHWRLPLLIHRQIPLQRARSASFSDPPTLADMEQVHAKISELEHLPKFVSVYRIS